MSCATRVSNNNFRNNFTETFSSVSNLLIPILVKRLRLTNYKTFLKKLLAFRPEALIVEYGIRSIVQIMTKKCNFFYNLTDSSTFK